MDQLLWEKPVHHRPRRLLALINLTGAVLAPLGRAWIVSRSLCLRESCMRENRTYSLSGGRWPARKCATSDPTTAGCPSTSLDKTAAKLMPANNRIMLPVSTAPAGSIVQAAAFDYSR